MLPKKLNPLCRQTRGFTLIEVMVTIAIILVLVTVLLAVGSSVRKNSQITATRAELKALEGIAEQFEREANQSLPLTYYANQGQGPGSPVVPTSGTVNFVDALYRYPTTKELLVKLVGDKLHITGTAGTSYILDTFGNPIHFIPQGQNPFGSGGAAATAEYFRSSGPDGATDWTTASSPQNADDILSTDALH